MTAPHAASRAAVAEAKAAGERRRELRARADAAGRRGA
jgi:hypothetical protein